MKTKQHLLSISILLAITLLSCSKDDSYNNAIVGKWNWVLTTGGFAGVHETPASTKQIWSYEFRSNNTYTLLRNDTIAASGNFTLSSTDANGLKTNIINMENSMIQSYIIQRDTLILADIYVCDGFISSYSRAK